MKRFFFNLLLGFFFITIILSSCQKQADNTAMDIEVLKASVASLQKRSDSLATALKNTNNNVSALSKEVDSIRVQLFQITTQIISLNSQLTTVNANITLINTQINDLNKKYIDLLNRLNALITEFTNTTAYLNSRIDSLSNSIKTLQKRSDSLTNALNITNSNLANYSRSVDTIKIQLVFIISQINQLNIQLSSTNANTSLINAQITILNQQYLDLVTRLNAILLLLNNVPPTINNGLVAWFPFTGNANDSSGNSNNGIISGAKLSSDRFGNLNAAYIFNGVTDYIKINNSSSLNNNTFSISGWFNSSSLSTNVSSGCKTIISKWWQSNSVCNGNYNAFNILLTTPITTSKLGAASAFYDGSVFYAPNVITTNIWYHFVFIHNAQSGGSIYLNGVLVNTNNISGLLCNSINPIYIGADNNNGNLWRYFDGKLDDIRIYNRVLNQEEITYLANH